MRYTLFYSAAPYVCLIFGLIMGSFFNVCIYRIPLNIFWKSSRSFCVHCGTPIPFWLNVPILSYISLGGKTRCCSKPIPIQYPLVELFSGLLFAFLYWRYPFLQKNALTLEGFNSWEFLRFTHAAIFSSFLLVCSVIDIKHMIIPDVLSLPMIFLGPLMALIHPELPVFDSLIGALLGAGSIYLIAWIYFLVRRREGIGMGDAKLLAAIGAWLGYTSLVPTVLFASLVGSLVGVILMFIKKQFDFQTEIPFGPFLSLGAAIYLLSPMHWMEMVTKLTSLFS